MPDKEESKEEIYKTAIQRIYSYCAQNRYSGWVDVEGIIDICNEVGIYEGQRKN